MEVIKHIERWFISEIDDWRDVKRKWCSYLCFGVKFKGEEEDFDEKEEERKYRQRMA